MSGLYYIQAHSHTNLQSLAALVSGRLGYNDDDLNHFAVAGRSVMGLVSPRKFSGVVMPRYLKQERLWGVMQGELYDSDILKQWRRENPGVADDLSLFASMYREGCLEENLSRLNGAFFVILWDVNADILVAANDRYGLYPMYWAHSSKGFCLSNRVLGSILSDVADAGWNLSGVSQLLTINDYLEQTTLIEGVEAFPQASLMIKTGGDIDIRSYWHYDFTPLHQKETGQALAEDLGGLFKRAIRRQAGKDRKIGVTLSGGLDSRCIAAAAAGENIPVKTFTWGKPGAYDRLLAGKVASRFNIQHLDCDYEYRNFEDRYLEGARITEGLINYFDCHMLAHLHLLQPHADVILNGYAGDLLFGGSYLRSAWLKSNSRTDLSRQLFEWRNDLVPERNINEWIPELHGMDKGNLPSSVFRRLFCGLTSDALPDAVDRFFLENRVRRQTSMGTVLIREVAESAACFFDYDFCDLVTSIPYALRYEHKIYLAMMRAALPEALAVRWQRTLLPASAPYWMGLPAKAFIKACGLSEGWLGWPHISSRQSPVDFPSWLRGPLKPWMDWVVNDLSPSTLDFLSHEHCRQAWRQHLNGQDRTGLLGAIASMAGFASVIKDARAKNICVGPRPVEVKETAGETT